MQDFRKLAVWEKSHLLTLKVYSATRNFPNEERYGLTSQVRRACGSIPANIAEGCGRGSNKDFANFLQIAFGSASEVAYHILLAKDLGLLTIENYSEFTNQINEIMKMLNSLISILRSNKNKLTTKN